jgi:hypothetical protein
VCHHRSGLRINRHRRLQLGVRDFGNMSAFLRREEAAESDGVRRVAQPFGLGQAASRALVVDAHRFHQCEMLRGDRIALSRDAQQPQRCRPIGGAPEPLPVSAISISSASTCPVATARLRSDRATARSRDTILDCPSNTTPRVPRPHRLLRRPQQATPARRRRDPPQHAVLRSAPDSRFEASQQKKGDESCPSSPTSQQSRRIRTVRESPSKSCGRGCHRSRCPHPYR